MSISGTTAIGSPTIRPLGSMPPSDRTNDAQFGQGATPLSSPTDEVEISSAARLMSDPAGPGDLRSERLAQIKAAIDDGTYDTDEKLDLALSRMIGAVWGDD